MPFRAVLGSEKRGPSAIERREGESRLGVI